MIGFSPEPSNIGGTDDTNQAGATIELGQHAGPGTTFNVHLSTKPPPG
ncbi:hypothetical protein [Actinoplanes sp. URMC 104]